MLEIFQISKVYFELSSMNDVHHPSSENNKLLERISHYIQKLKQITTEERESFNLCN